jgi:alkanesulfonate monooxygenase SsuD/methylene tetrahydromethanopterin reductase-like flavin-dependent oxidoreductase (luciferase family)
VSASTKFGYCVPIFANPGAAYFRTPRWTELDPRLAVAAAVEAERLGYDSVWVADHLMHGFDDGIMEGWTTLSVIAGQTSTIQLGSIHMAQPFRHPAIAAKMAATLDALSGGRLIFFYDCGWQEAEVRAYGLDWPPEEERIARMEEGLELITALWSAHEPLNFTGTYFHTKEAMCRPAPVKRPPIWLGEIHSGSWLDAVVRHADGWNSTPASIAALHQRIEALKAACQRAGRDFSELELSLEIQILVGPTHKEVRQIAREIAELPLSKRGSPRQDILDKLKGGDGPLTVDDWLIGTPDEVRTQLQAYEQLGVTHFMLWFVDFPSLDGMRLFMQ